MASSSNENRLWPKSRWEVSAPTDSPAKPTLGDLVMAWARDSATGEPRYICELGEERRGAKCGCECYSCGLPLTAINAAKKTFRKRPHFRHPDGAQRDSCLVLAARAVALEMLKTEGVLRLPRRRQSARIEGLSGQYHDAWVEAPSENVCISDFRFFDQVTGVLTLDDGRQLKVILVGSVEQSRDQSNPSSLIPTILLTVDDPEIAAMAPEDLKKRLKLIVDGAFWCSYWNDADLIQQATEAARAKAEAALDWLDDVADLPEGTSAETKRETLLHIKAKEILERERRILLPSLHVEAEADLPNGESLRKSDCILGLMVQLESVTLEKQLGRIKPDVVAKTVAANDWAADQLLIEITVTNTISVERMERIRRQNLPTIEIDISRMGGVVTEAEFTKLVVEEQAGKRWLHHPRMEQEKTRLALELANEVSAVIELEKEKAEQERKRAEVRQVPSHEWGRAYLESVQHYGNLRACSDDPGSDPQILTNALIRVLECANGLVIHGFREAEDKDLFSYRGNIVDRLLSIKQDCAVGYKLDTAWQVINAILQERPPYSQWQTLYLIAIKVYGPTLSERQAEKVAAWRTEVKQSLENSEETYKRSRKYDRLLSLLFPEMAESLEKPLLGKISRTSPKSIGTADQALSYPVQRRGSDFWLSGHELDEWKKSNPDSAAAWFGEEKKK